MLVRIVCFLIMLCLSVALAQTTFTPTPTPTPVTNVTAAPDFVFERDGVTVIVLTSVMVGIALLLCGCVIIGDNIQYAREKKKSG
jgi:hypothetical protein